MIIMIIWWPASHSQGYLQRRALALILRGGPGTWLKAWLVCCAVRALGIVVKGSDDNGQKSHVTMMTTMTMMTKDMRVLSPCRRPACQAVCTQGGSSKTCSSHLDFGFMFLFVHLNRRRWCKWIGNDNNWESIKAAILPLAPTNDRDQVWTPAPPMVQQCAIPSYRRGNIVDLFWLQIDL